jgi:hypothetical protein
MQRTTYTRLFRFVAEGLTQPNKCDDVTNFERMLEHPDRAHELLLRAPSVRLTEWIDRWAADTVAHRTIRINRHDGISAVVNATIHRHGPGVATVLAAKCVRARGK